MTKDEALRLALEALENSEPNKRKGDDDCREIGWMEHREAITAIKAALEAKDEPVAWVDERAIAWLAKHPYGNVTTGLELQESFERPMPLYATPPQRKPLTNQQIAKILEHGDVAESNDKVGWYVLPYSFARAIEAAHGIKGEA